MLFWTQQQKVVLDSIKEERHSIILGDYGTGKTLILMAVAEKMMKMGREVVYINALDNWDDTSYFKTWESALDVILKARFGDGATVLDMGTLRRDYLAIYKGRQISFRQVISIL